MKKRSQKKIRNTEKIVEEEKETRGEAGGGSEDVKTTLSEEE